MKPIALAVALAVSFRWCGSAPVADVKVYAVITVNGSHMLMFTAVYRADASKQTVLWWVEGVPNSQTALEKCNVVDALNWRCEGSETGASGSAMVNGRYGDIRRRRPRWLEVPDRIRMEGSPGAAALAGCWKRVEYLIRLRCDRGVTADFSVFDRSHGAFQRIFSAPC